MRNRLPVKIQIALLNAAFRRTARKAEKQEQAYNKMIAESKTKIGPYVPQPCPVQIWA